MFMAVLIVLKIVKSATGRISSPWVEAILDFEIFLWKAGYL